MSGKIRAFLAADPDGRLRSNLEKWRTELLTMPWANKIKWVPMPNIHLTLRFLGELSTTQLQSVADCVNFQLLAENSLSVELSPPRWFPKPSRPHVIAAIATPTVELLRLVQRLEQCAQTVQLPAETRPYHGHITLGRCRPSFPKHAELPHFSASTTLCIDRIVLYQSELLREGAKYSVLKTYSLTRHEAE